MSPHQPSDEVLIRRFRDGDETAFRALHARHAPRVTMTIRRLLGIRRQDADVAQDTWLAACRGLHAYRGDAPFSAWLSAIAARHTYAALSRLSRRESDGEDEIAMVGVDPEEPAIDLERALAGLRDMQRLVVVLHDVEGFTHEEIAEQLGIAVGTSKATLFRARRALRMSLNGGAQNATR